MVEESHSDWCSPIVLVGKPDGSARFCVDYRRVNAVSNFDAYPMPRFDKLVDRLGMATYYTTLDCTKVVQGASFRAVWGPGHVSAADG